MEELEISAAAGEHAARVLYLRGPLTLRTIFDFQAIAREQSSSPLIIDLGGVSYMDSAGLGAILGLLASAQRKHLGFAVTGASDRIRALFEVTQVEGVLPQFATLSDAEASLARVASA